jgi:transcriptional regulator with XRE-family HTH domain
MTPQHIRTLRRSGQWSQKKFAALVGVSEPTINRWERGKCSPLPVFRAKLQELARQIVRGSQ